MGLTDGCEFIDDGNFGKPILFPPSQEPWRETDGAFEVPVSFLRLISDEKYLVEIRHQDNDKIDHLVSDISENGLKEPLTIVIDSLGSLRLQDGYHRLSAMFLLNFRAIPVVLRETDGRIRARGVHMSRLIEPLLRSMTDWNDESLHSMRNQ